MKKIIYFIAMILLATACCEVGETPTTVSTETARERIYLSGYGTAYNVYKFTYKNHQYIMVKGVEQMAIEHDPDCHCHQKIY